MAARTCCRRSQASPLLGTARWAVGALLLLLAARSGAALSSEDCLACHDNAELTASDGHRVTVAAAPFAASAHAVLACTDCHGDVTEIPHGTGLKAVSLDACAVCHADEVAAYREGVHATARGEATGAACADCHGDLHAVLPHDNPASAAHWSHLVGACAKCHADRSVIERAGLSIAPPVEAYREGVHGRAVAAGTRAAVCSDCHGAHAILPASNPRSTISRANVVGTCGACHADVAAEYRDSVHGKALARGVHDAPVCVDCHGEHRILPHGDPTSPTFAANIPGETCGRCHGDVRLIRRYGLPDANVATFRESFHGLALRAGQVDVANCASCHGVHAILPSSDPRSLINPANLPATCGKCHPGAGTNFPIGLVHVLPTTSSTRIEYWVRAIYMWLIAIVIGGMALHNALDLAVKARRSPGLPQPPPVIVPERMSRPLRWQHGLVMLSFPVLVYTGFALTYPESWWAEPLLRWEGRFALRGTLHRIAAVVLLVALSWHVLHWAASARGRRHLRALLPSWRDVRDVAARLAYYAGRRSGPPHGVKFSYIEKAEYWAFIWGMLVMTLSGVPLWFSDASLRYLPKWVTDVATAVHFYEAVLAALAILVWHLYWVIFDPDVYPMDWSWWTGKPPPSRVHERQSPPAEGRGEDRR